MNYSLVSADRRTHLKIVAVAIFAIIVLGLAAHETSISSAGASTAVFTPAVAKPHLPSNKSLARAETISVCRFNAL